MHARYYSSNLGRFLSVDPVGGKVGSSQSWNRYSYVRNNPVAFIDPNGEELRLGADPARGIAAVKLMLPVGVRNAVTVGRNDSDQPTVLIDPSAESDSS
jgi:uncharacterized protein RhaS with RHS repeats